jgi:hypothetical protein
MDVIILTKNMESLILNDGRKFKAEKTRPGNCSGCAFEQPCGCDLNSLGIADRIGGTYCVAVDRPDNQSIIWKEEK